MSIRIGVQLPPQHCTFQQFIAAVQAAEQAGADTIFTWDHFYPLYGQPGCPIDAPPVESPHLGDHFEAWTLLTAMACHTRKAEVGLLVGCNGYRNPQLVADMARTVDHISNGRLILGIGSGWFERDYQEYGFDFGTAGSRLKELDANLPLIKSRLAKLTPPPTRPLPIMIGGGGEKVTLRIVAEHATMWNGVGTPEEFAHKNGVLDEWCRKLGRDPKSIERTCMMPRLQPGDEGKFDEFKKAGAEMIILGIGYPFDLTMLEKLVAWRKGV